MEAILQAIIDHELQDFAGAEIRGQLAIADEVVNELLTEIITATRAPATQRGPARPPAATAVAPAPDLGQLLAWLDIRRLSYRTEAGRTVLDLEVGID